MSTRLTKKETDENSVPTGYEGDNVPEDFSLPACTIEDVDRSLFTLFDREIPFMYTHKGANKRIPVIFATGERFAVLRRKRPLRDRNGALILPLISIMRTGVSQEAQMGPGQTAPLTIRKRLDKSDREYQRLVNKARLKNQKSAVSSLNRVITEDGVQDTGAVPGTVSSRRRAQGQTPLAYRRGELLRSNVAKNIVEILTIPPVKYYTSTYEITFWAQYTQQMNNMIMAMMSVYQNNHRRTFKLETEKGYWFVGYVGEALSPGNNFDDFTDNERLVRYSFEVSVPGYVVGGDYPGAEPFLRKFLSAPEISFDSTQTTSAPLSPLVGGTASGKPGRYILQDIETDDSLTPGSGVAESANIEGGPRSNVDAGPTSATLGGFSDGGSDIVFVRVEKDPFTGKESSRTLKIKTRNQRKGETVYREQITNDMDLES